jgi:putative proteasome-type protease
MTYCLGIKVKEGLVGISDTRITSGTEVSTARKVTVHQMKNHTLFILTSGLRSVRDKAITYFREEIAENDQHFNKMYKAVNALASQVRRVAAEDKAALSEAGLDFNLHAIVGGQLENDEAHKLYLLYPQGNWIEIGENSPFVIIGNSGYGKPLLYRNLHYGASMREALKLGFLSFDATKVSANDVDYPIDVVIYPRDSFNMIEKRFEREQMEALSKDWNRLLRESINQLSDKWMESFLFREAGLF